MNKPDKNLKYFIRWDKKTWSMEKISLQKQATNLFIGYLLGIILQCFANRYGLFSHRDYNWNLCYPIEISALIEIFFDCTIQYSSN